MSAEEDERIEGILTDVIVEHQLDESFRRTLRDMLAREDDRWRVCCGSDCNPCVEQIGRAVDSARARLRRLGSA